MNAIKRFFRSFRSPREQLMAEAYEAETLFQSGHVCTDECYDDMFYTPPESVALARSRLASAARVVAEEVLGEGGIMTTAATLSVQTMTANMLVRMREEGLI